MANLLKAIDPGFEPVTAEDAAARFGPIPLWRIRTDPAPGTANEADVLRIHDSTKRLCELVDGILVEKAVGFDESILAVWIATLLTQFVRPRKLGFVAGEAGMYRLSPELIRIPDVSFVSKTRYPRGRRPKGRVPRLAPNLAVEILSESNTEKEMRQKLREYFESGVELVWLVDGRSRTVTVHTKAEEGMVLKEPQTLTGGDVLPGFQVELSELFDT